MGDSLIDAYRVERRDGAAIVASRAFGRKPRGRDATRLSNMAHGTPTLASASSGAARLQPSYRRVEAEELEAVSSAPSVHDVHMVQYGYHDGSSQHLPPHLVRYIEPTEGEFDLQVEYDMDEQGACCF